MMKKLVGLLIVVALATSTAWAKEPKIYALLVGDATPSAQWGKLLPNITFDVIVMETMLWQNIPRDQLELIPLLLEQDEQARPETILNAIARLKPTQHDTLLVYFTGHGAVDDHGHHFVLAGRKLYRDDLRRQMLQRKTRLAVLLSDCCNVRSDGRNFVAALPQVEEPDKATPIFTSLLLKPQGVVDINGSSPGESAFFTPEPREPGEFPGSLFTKALTEYVSKNRSRSPSWDHLLIDVGMKVHVAFRAGYPKGAAVAKGGVAQRDQTVYAIEYPDMPEKQGPRTGVKVRDQRGGGAWIFAVDAGSPATRVFDLAARKYVSLQPGQVIVTANGRSISGASDFAAIVKASPQILRFTAGDSRGSREYLMRLRY